MIVTLARLFAKAIIGFIGFSLLLVIAFKFVPVPVTATMLMDENGFTKDWESLDNIDRNLVAAVIAAEDSRFCQHNGFDTEAIEVAMRANMQGGRIRGGSSISQQTAKNVFLWQNGGYFRKGLEAWFTFLIENMWGKQRIIEVYLNVAETGIGTYGAEAGAQRYFNTSAARLSANQAARMAAALPSPKKRAVVNPTGWLAGHGRRLEKRIAIVKRDGLDACVYD
jgi:monofunctional biosynthetic peptidoglycan transglycosylase